MINIEVGPVYSQIKGLDDLKIIDELSKELSYLVPSHKYSFQYRYGGWDGREHLLTKKLQFPTGLVSKVQTFLDNLKLDCNICEKILYPSETESISWMGPDLYSYQEEVVEKALSSKRGMIKACTGSGKT